MGKSVQAAAHTLGGVVSKLVGNNFVTSVAFGGGLGDEQAQVERLMVMNSGPGTQQCGGRTREGHLPSLGAGPRRLQTRARLGASRARTRESAQDASMAREKDF